MPSLHPEKLLLNCTAHYIRGQCIAHTYKDTDSQSSKKYNRQQTDYSTRPTMNRVWLKMKDETRSERKYSLDYQIYFLQRWVLMSDLKDSSKRTGQRNANGGEKEGEGASVSRNREEGNVSRRRTNKTQTIWRKRCPL